MPETRRHIAGDLKRPKVLSLAYNEEERARWDADARLLGFNTCGSHYLRFLLNGRADGRFMLLDPAAMQVFQTVGKMMGQEAGEVLARVQRAYLEGR